MKIVAYLPADKREGVEKVLHERFPSAVLLRPDTLDDDVFVFSFHIPSPKNGTLELYTELHAMQTLELLYAFTYYEPVERVELRNHIFHLLKTAGIAQAVTPDGRMAEITSDGTKFFARVMHSGDVSWNWKNTDMDSLLDQGAFFATTMLDAISVNQWTESGLILSTPTLRKQPQGRRKGKR